MSTGHDTTSWLSKMNFLLRYMYCGVCFPWVMLRAPFSRPRRAFIKHISTLLGWAYPTPAAAVPKCSLADVWPLDGACRIMAPETADGNVSLLELLCINGVVMRNHPMRIFEIGTFDGRTSLNMIANAPEDAHLWTLDLPPQNVESTAYRLDEGEKAFVRKTESGARFRSSSYRDRITQIYADSGRYDPQELTGVLDLVFVDGSHSFDYVLSDTRLALRLLRSGGVIIWHDYDGVWPDVTHALNQIYSENTRLRSMHSLKGTTLVVARVDADELSG